MHLFDPITLRGVTLRNRIVVSPMCQYSSDDGFANEWHLVHLGQFAVGGAGLVFTEATAVLTEGRISPQDLGLWKDEHADWLARIGRFVRQQGAVFGSQLAHAGRKSSTVRPWDGGGPLDPSDGGWSPIVAPSATPFDAAYQTPAALDAEGIDRVIRAFRDAARRALDAGVQVLELHSAHGYLMHEFLSPLSNTRSDRYGGSFENRTRFVREIVASVRTVWPEHVPLFVRISASDWRDGGWTIEDSIALARLLKSDGVDLVDCSSGGIVPSVPIPTGAGYQVPFAERVRREAGIPTGAVGMITSPEQADTIIRSGSADVVLLARELLRDPHWPLRAAHALRQEIAWPRPYERAKIW
jgi:2,4-dienoyl-CoA reductase-like NADH-dependent reductase (Old Yellow Enzyme family)